mmetsp:Transcript_3937/g.10111  ORF Transcript_3937/g.10111 Transcript_3937/m.10111 type:complete len:229 (-) Transcript_3937:1090-1776(-)
MVLSSSGGLVKGGVWGVQCELLPLLAPNAPSTAEFCVSLVGVLSRAASGRPPKTCTADSFSDSLEAMYASSKPSAAPPSPLLPAGRLAAADSLAFLLLLTAITPQASPAAATPPTANTTGRVTFKLGPPLPLKSSPSSALVRPSSACSCARGSRPVAFSLRNLFPMASGPSLAGSTTQSRMPGPWRTMLKFRVSLPSEMFVRRYCGPHPSLISRSCSALVPLSSFCLV